MVAPSEVEREILVAQREMLFGSYYHFPPLASCEKGKATAADEAAPGEKC